MSDRGRIQKPAPVAASREEGFAEAAAGRQPSVRSLWLAEALAQEPNAEPVELSGSASADVCIVGGGFTEGAGSERALMH